MVLVSRGLVPSRARALARIMAGDVIVNDQRVDKAGVQVDVSAVIRLKGDDIPFVSRGGLKLDAAIAHFRVDVVGRVCVDVGASTGGFTDVLLARGAQRVFAIDVGRAQLHEKLRQDARVISMEQTHIVKLAAGALDPAPTLGVVDVSFISLVPVLPAMARQLAPTCDVVALVKPQFEVGRAHIGKGGIVKDAVLQQRAVDEVIACARSVGFNVHGQLCSPITGADGNVEFLVHLSR